MLKIGYSSTREHLPGIILGVDKIEGHFPRHGHEYIEMTMVLSGNGTEIINGISHELSPGTLTLLFPWHVHELMSNAGEVIQLFKCSFELSTLLEPNMNSELSEFFLGNLNFSPFVKCSALEAKEIQGLFSKINSEMELNKVARNSMIKIKTLELIISFIRIYSEHNREAIPSEIDEKSFVWSVVNYIHCNYVEDLSIDDVARKFNYSESGLSRMLRNYTGLSFKEIQNHARILYSCVSLVTTNAQISMISKLVGFNSIKTFEKVFMELKGISPEEYRKNFGTLSKGIQKYDVEQIGLVWEIIYYLHLHYQEDISAMEICKLFHFSESYINRLLKMYSCNSFNELLHEIRIYHACILLATTKLTIYDISLEVGYDSRKTFTRTFERLRSVSPSYYRCEQRKNVT